MTEMKVIYVYYLDEQYFCTTVKHVKLNCIGKLKVSFITSHINIGVIANEIISRKSKEEFLEESLRKTIDEAKTKVFRTSNQIIECGTSNQFNEDALYGTIEEFRIGQTTSQNRILITEIYPGEYANKSRLTSYIYLENLPVTNKILDFDLLEDRLKQKPKELEIERYRVSVVREGSNWTYDFIDEIYIPSWNISINNEFDKTTNFNMTILFNHEDRYMEKKYVLNDEQSELISREKLNTCEITTFYDIVVEYLKYQKHILKYSENLEVNHNYFSLFFRCDRDQHYESSDVNDYEAIDSSKILPYGIKYSNLLFDIRANLNITNTAKHNFVEKFYFRYFLHENFREKMRNYYVLFNKDSYLGAYKSKNEVNHEYSYIVE